MPGETDSSGPVDWQAEFRGQKVREETHNSPHMERQAFESLVHEALKDLPQLFKDKLENVAIIVEDYPSEELLERMEVPDDETLFGLYEGVPLTERGFFDAPLHPDRVFIFQGPIEEACTSPEEIKEEVRITVAHELAHFFGFDDEELEDAGY